MTYRYTGPSTGAGIGLPTCDLSDEAFDALVERSPLSRDALLSYWTQESEAKKATPKAKTTTEPTEPED